MSNYRLIYIYCILSFFAIAGARAQDTADSTKVYQLPEVTISEPRQPSAYLATSPSQRFDNADFAKVGAFQVADALRFFSGIQVKDYGGVGGLKTVSIRNLGANYTAVAYDGIGVSNLQTGQIDLGRYSLHNVAMVSVAVGEADDSLQPALLLASAGTVHITTQSLDPDAGKRQLKLGLRAGSFGTINPSFVYNRRISRMWTVNATSEYLRADGTYPYTQPIGTEGETERRYRRNSDVGKWTSELNVVGCFRNGSRLATKAYYLDSNRGIPGSATYHLDYSAERERERNLFVQSSYSLPLAPRMDFRANAKYSRTHQEYTDIKSIYEGGRRVSLYNQEEYYLNATLRYRLSDRFSLSWANDALVGSFRSNLANNVSPRRASWLSALSARYATRRLTLNASLLNHEVKEFAEGDKAHTGKRHLSPYAGLSVQPLASIPLRLRAHYKNTYRLPTFGDMYNSPVTPVDLMAENAHQFNLGAVWVSQAPRWPLLSVTVDAYRNRVDNKIVAIPKSSMFVWSVQNYGRVSINGLDVRLDGRAEIASGYSLDLSGTYSLQDVRYEANRTVPYTPRHSGSGVVSLSTPYLTVNYHLLYCGSRYYNQLKQPVYRLPAYWEQGVSVGRELSFRSFQLHLSAECNNLFDRQYEVVRSFPMPGRTFRIAATLRF